MLEYSFCAGNNPPHFVVDVPTYFHGIIQIMTALDITQIAPKAREHYVRIGRRYGSDDTLKQANMTLDALKSHASTLVDYGFAADDGAMLAAARDSLSAANTGRESITTAKKITRKEYIAAVQLAKSARKKARTILENTLLPLAHAGKDDSVQKVEAILSQTSALPTNGRDEALAAQLDQLATAFTDSIIANTAQNRGGGQALNDLQNAASSLRSAAEDRDHSGTRLSTEEMDMLDGLIVTLCRAARNAAKQAARGLGTPALFAQFALNHIGDEAEHRPKTPVTTPATP